MRKALAIAALAPFLFAAGPCGDDDGGGGGTDDEAACEQYCAAQYADDLEGCEWCAVDVTYDEETGVCTCEFLSCVSDLCTGWCQADGGTSTGTCYLDSCTCS